MNQTPGPNCKQFFLFFLSKRPAQQKKKQRIGRPTFFNQEFLDGLPQFAHYSRTIRQINRQILYAMKTQYMNLYKELPIITVLHGKINLPINLAYLDKTKQTIRQKNKEIMDGQKKGKDTKLSVRLFSSSFNMYFTAFC